MKKPIFLSLALFTHLLLFAQNYISNPSFETVTGTSPHNFFGGEVTGWFAVGGASEVVAFDGCDVDVYPQHEDYLAKLAFGQAIVNKLTRPIFYDQQLNLTFWAHPGACDAAAEYVLEFFVSNTVSNTNDGLPWSIPAATYLKVGEQKLHLSSDSWKKYETTLDVSSMLDFPIPCGYQYLVVGIRPFLSNVAPAAPELNEFDYVLLDNLELTACTSLMTSSILYNVDNDGICSKVLFTADCSDMSGVRYIWNFGDGTCETDTFMNTDHTYDQLGNYTVTLTVIDEMGCVSTTTEEIAVDCERCVGINADFNAACIECTPIYVGDPKTHSTIFVGYSCKYNATDQSMPSSGSTVTSWEWSNGSTVISTLQNPIISLSAIDDNGGPIPTTFTATLCLQIQDANGCRASICKPVSLPCIENGGSSGRAMDFQGQLDVFPNPSAEGSVTLRVPDLQDALLNVFDLQGQVVKQWSLPQGQTEMKLDMGDVSTGMYIFMVKDVRGFQQYRKVVFQR